MKSIWKPFGLILGLMAVAGGTMMLLGNVHSEANRSAELEFTKLKSMAAVWQSRLDGTRSALREQCMVQGMLDITESPGDWATWRAAQKYEAAMQAWNSIYGKPRGMALILGSKQLHSAAGDTAGLGAVMQGLENDHGDVTILNALFGGDGCVAVHYTIAASHPAQQSARFVALLNRSQVLPVENSPNNWHLLASPDDPRFSSAPGAALSRISAATWPLLLQQNYGMIPGTVGDQWGFAKIQLPGNGPYLLVGSLHVPQSSQKSASVLILAGALALGMTALLPRRSSRNNMPPTPHSEPAPDAPPASDSNSYRDIFQSISDPLCVIESDGRVTRVNHAAQGLLNVKKGLPDHNIYFEHGDIQVVATDFLKQIAAYPKENSGPCRMVNGETLLFSGHVAAQRLYADQYHHGPVLLQFHAELPAEEQPTDADFTAAPEPLTPEMFAPDTVDLSNPYPILRVSADGVIEQYNDAAQTACPEIESSPLISDALPALSGNEWRDLVKFSDTRSLETVFGGQTYEFRLVRLEKCVLLYGYPGSESKNLNISLEQAQTNFNALCNLVPAAVMLVDVHTHTVLQCNMQCCDLFSMPAPALVGNRLENLSAFPWEFSNEQEQEFYAQTPDGRTIRCSFECELIKVDGEPTMLAVLNPVYQSNYSTEPTTETETPSVPPESLEKNIENLRGPGILIVSNPVVRDVARKLLARFGHDCEAFTSLDDATIWLISHDSVPNFITLDLTDFDGAAEWLNDMRARYGHVPVIAITDGEVADVPASEDAYLLTKPFDLDTVEHALKELHVEPVLDDA